MVVPAGSPGAAIRRHAMPVSHTWTSADDARVQELRAWYLSSLQSANASTSSAPPPSRAAAPMQIPLPFSMTGNQMPFVHPFAGHHGAQPPPSSAATTAVPSVVVNNPPVVGGNSEMDRLRQLRADAGRGAMTLLTDCQPGGAACSVIAKLIQVNQPVGAGQGRKLLAYLWDGTGACGDNSAWGLTVQPPAVGVVIKFAMWDPRLFAMFQVNDLTGQWVTVHGCVVKKYLDETEIATYKRTTSVALVPDSDPRVLQRIAFAEARLGDADDETRANAAAHHEVELERAASKARRLAKDERVAAAIDLARRNNNVLTRVHHPNAPITMLRDVVECEHDVWRWRVRVSAVAVLPTSAVHMCRPYCTECKELLPCAPIRTVGDERAASAKAPVSQAVPAENERENQLVGGGTTFVIPRPGMLSGQKRALADAAAAAADDGSTTADGNTLAATHPPLPPCARCGRVPTEWRYLLGLRVRDDTAAIDVLLVDEDAVDFFEDVPAGDLRQNNCSRNVLEKKIAALLLPNQKIELCIQSHVPDAPPPPPSGAASGAASGTTDSSVLPATTRVYSVFDTFIPRAEWS